MSIKRIIAILFALLLALSAVPVLAESDTEWRSDLLRMNDLSEVMTEQEVDELNSRACTAVEERKFDFVMITFTTAMRDEAETDAEYITYLYDNNELGYGADHDGIVFAVNTETESYVIGSFGRGAEIFNDTAIKDMCALINDEYKSNGLAAAFGAFLDSAVSEVFFYQNEYDPDTHHYGKAVVTGSFYSEPASENGASEASEMPPWYPTDPGAGPGVPISHDAPRVVDDADILTDAEEQRLEARIREVAPLYDTDIVIFTDNSTHGLERRVYAADFYDFNGYGCGPDRDGFCLFICMDPNARGGWCCVTGERSRSLYTEDNANKIDDVLYPQLKKGEYYEAFYDWVGNIGGLLDKGVAFAPDWFPSIKDGAFVRTHDASAPRVLDDANLISAEDEAKLIEKINSIKEKYGVDVVINTSWETYGMSENEYLDKLYTYKGYGLGDNYDGVILGLFAPEEDIEINAYGSAREKLTEKNVGRLSDAASSRMNPENYFSAADRWLDYLDTTLRTGRTPRLPLIWVIRSAISGVVGLISGSAVASSKKRTMKTVRTAYSANDHLVSGSCNMYDALDQFVSDDVTRVYSPVRTDSGRDSGGSSGGSSYSGGYSGSSGSSHSGSGRDF